MNSEPEMTAERGRVADPVVGSGDRVPGLGCGDEIPADMSERFIRTRAREAEPANESGSVKIEAVGQQDAVLVEGDYNSVAISQIQSWDGEKHSIAIFGKANVDAVIAALQQARDAMP